MMMMGVGILMMLGWGADDGGGGGADDDDGRGGCNFLLHCTRQCIPKRK